MGEITFRVYPDLAIVHFLGFGDISYDMIIEKIQQLHKHPDWSFELNTFIDFEQAVVKTDHEGLLKYQSFFNALQDKTPPRKWAIYTHQNTTHKSANMSHLFITRSIAVDVFQFRDDALQFLGVSPQRFITQTTLE